MGKTESEAGHNLVKEVVEVVEEAGE